MHLRFIQVATYITNVSLYGGVVCSVDGLQFIRSLFEGLWIVASLLIQ